MPPSGDQPFSNEGIFSESSIQDFLAEADEQLTGVEEQLLALEENRGSRAAIGEMFRYLHGLKGNAGLILSEADSPLPETHPLLYLQTGSHAVESAVDEFRTATSLQVSDEEMAFLFMALDFLQRQVRAFRQGRLEPITDLLLLARLGLSAKEVVGGGDPKEEDRERVFLNVGRQGAAASRVFLDQLPAGALPAVGNLRRSLETLIKAARYGDRQPVLELALRQMALVDQALNSSEPLANLPLEELRALQQEVEAELSQEMVVAEDYKPLAQEELPSSTIDSGQGVIRVQQRKVDDLMRLVGQMVVLRNQFSNFVERAEQTGALNGLQGELRDLNDGFARASSQLEHDVMALRLVPLRNLFQRLQRLVRDLSVSLGKEISLVTEGEEIQLDKTLIDHLGEPLVHLLRNSADHGIEKPDARQREGKPAAGTITVRAYNEGLFVVIVISDDGSGLDTAGIRARAVRAGLISDKQAAEMTDTQVHEFIFHPGFSTAEIVTSVSGRGVGLDLVRNTIRTLRGTLTVASAAGAGTDFQIRLPASVLVSRGILVKSGEEEYILPVESIRDLVRIDAADLCEYRETQMAAIGGQVLPILFLSELLGGTFPRTTDDSLAVAVLDSGATLFGLAVDQFTGDVQTVIQPLKAPFRGFEICIGAAILGNGRVVLVLDPVELSKHVFDVADAPERVETVVLADART